MIQLSTLTQAFPRVTYSFFAMRYRRDCYAFCNCSIQDPKGFSGRRIGMISLMNILSITLFFSVKLLGLSSYVYCTYNTRNYIYPQ